MTEFVIPAGTLVKRNGIPALIKVDVVASTAESNQSLFLSQLEQSVEKPIQADSPDSLDTSSRSLESMNGDSESRI